MFLKVKGHYIHQNRFAYVVILANIIDVNFLNTKKKEQTKR